ncbi:hypothetical protein [Dulcicalothrix desertica]|uniref:hypothetical protein n=1 Tax=Dulcicalothrix desertica TaxID=32056 RepID=UPI001C99DA76|nr:hypothetical protein [Dulcicalothrix desertica]
MLGNGRARMPIPQDMQQGTAQKWYIYMSENSYRYRRLQQSIKYLNSASPVRAG